jgi:hypothetical protein
MENQTATSTGFSLAAFWTFAHYPGFGEVHHRLGNDLQGQVSLFFPRKWETRRTVGTIHS